MIVSLFAIIFVWFLVSQIRKSPAAGDKAFVDAPGERAQAGRLDLERAQCLHQLADGRRAIVDRHDDGQGWRVSGILKHHAPLRS